VTRGALVYVCARAAARASPSYQALCVQVRDSPVVSPDETGWKAAGTLYWLWAFATADTTVYAIRPGRGFMDAATILGEDFAGVLARDGWAPYRRFVHADHQSCLAHLLRRCRLLQRFAAHLTVEASALFTFLSEATIDATNWRAEHAIRPAVVMRNVCGGNRSARGAETQQVLTSLLRTTHQRGLDPAATLVTLLRAPTPIVPLPLQAPPR
jgi:transposase